MQRSQQLETVTTAPENTESLGVDIGERLRGGECIVIAGALGAGKTTLVRGVCRGLEVPDEVLSPTFILYEAFAGRVPVVHLDLYRLEHERELEDLGVFDPAGENTVILAEWGDRSEALVSQCDALVTIAARGAGERRVSIACTPEVARVLEGMDAW